MGLTQICKRLLPLMIAIAYFLTRSSIANTEIDQDHLKLYPYCGRMSKDDPEPSSSRIVNSRDSRREYPWVVFVKRMNIRKNKNKGNSYCSGSVITSRHAISAGHCICSKERGDPKGDPDARCLDSDKDQIQLTKNEITVFGGSKDIHKMKSHNDDYKYPVQHAYVMDGPKHAFSEGIDIGIIELQATKPFFDETALKTNLKLQDEASVLPICLAAENYEFVHSSIYSVGWGSRYDELPEENANTRRNALFSSCMTNEVGKEEWKFQACDMAQIRKLGWSCNNKQLPPDMTEAEVVQCDKYFSNAEKSLASTHIGAMKRVDKIYITKSNDEKIVCYRKRYFSEIGWCHVAGHYGKASANAHGWIKNKGAWGFCSPSCNENIMQGGFSKSNPKIYQEIAWKVDGRNDNVCSSYSNFDIAYEVCMKTELPMAEVGEFSLEPSSENIKLLTFRNEENRRNGKDIKESNTSYISGCDGDSGSGQWIDIDWLDVKQDKSTSAANEQLTRNMLVSIYTKLFSSIMINNKLEKGVCGGDILFIDGRHLVSAPVSTKTTYEKILTWIKEKAKIHKTR